MAGWLTLFICLSQLKTLSVFIDIPLPIPWYANNLPDALLILGMLWSTVDAPQCEESNGNNLKLDPCCKVNVLETCFFPFISTNAL